MSDKTTKPNPHISATISMRYALDRAGFWFPIFFLGFYCLALWTNAYPNIVPEHRSAKIMLDAIWWTMAMTAFSYHTAYNMQENIKILTYDWFRSYAPLLLGGIASLGLTLIMPQLDPVLNSGIALIVNCVCYRNHVFMPERAYPDGAEDDERAV